MRDSISKVGSDYVLFALIGVIALVVTLVYHSWVSVSSNNSIVVEFAVPTQKSYFFS